jgi:hypothetical protein
MGHAKDREIEEMDQGWSYSDRTICARCLSDPYLRALVKETASQPDCSFCERSGSKPIAIPFNELMAVISDTIRQYYGHVDNEAIAYDSETGDYVGVTYDTYDLVHDEIPTPSERDDVLDEIIDSLGHNLWCDKEPYAITGPDLYNLSWGSFCNTVKHQTRFFFGSGEVDRDSEIIPVPLVLGELSGIIRNAGLITPLPAGTTFVRLRAQKTGETCNSWRSLGSPPPERATSNRMSAAGISMFYASFDVGTARAETTASLDMKESVRLTAGTWTNTRTLRVLDLSRLPEKPNFYARQRWDLDQLIFLEEFVSNITQPVVHDGREHIDYVPTQILTEYFRHVYKEDDGGRSMALFIPARSVSAGTLS